MKTRAQRGADRIQAQAQAQARVTAASSAKQSTVEITLLGDSIPPNLAENITDLQQRIGAIEQQP